MLTHNYTRREASRGDSAESARTSLGKGGSPSTLAVLEIGKESKQAAKNLAAATANNPDHRPTKAASKGGAVRARPRANNRTKLAAPASANLDAENDQAAPPRPPELRVGAFLATAGICKGCSGGDCGGGGAPADVSRDTTVVSTASSEPSHKRSPLAVTSSAAHPAVQPGG